MLVTWPDDETESTCSYHSVFCGREAKFGIELPVGN